MFCKTIARCATVLALSSVPAHSVGLSQTNAQATQGHVQLAGLVADVGAADRILYGDRLRTLTQVMASAACHVKADVDYKQNRQLLRAGIDQFDVILDALEFGNPDLHIIGVETDSKILRKLAEVRRKWDILKPSYLVIKEDPENDEARAIIYTKTDMLLESTGILLAYIEAAHSNPVELLQSDALLLEIVGRQAMVSQRLSYEACKVWSGIGKEQDIKDLHELTAMFERSITALLKGEPMLGIKPAPTEEIAAGLNSVLSDWNKIGWKLRTLADNGTISKEEIEYLCRKLFGKMARIEKITHQYAEYSRRVY